MRMYVLARTCTCAFYLVGGGLIIEANIPVRVKEGRVLIFGRIRYMQSTSCGRTMRTCGMSCYRV